MFGNRALSQTVEKLGKTNIRAKVNYLYMKHNSEVIKKSWCLHIAVYIQEQKQI